jgi:pyruvate, orthophosphate dikinase
MARYIRTFEEGGAEQKDLLGGKGANLAEMTRMGLCVPPGFIITTDACREYLRAERLPDGLADEIRDALAGVEDQAGRRFGDPTDPLLVSVRSGARFSMPGMMDTVLNIGLNRDTLKGLAAVTGNETPAYDAYRRLLDMFGRIVLGVDEELFRDVRARLVEDAGVTDASQLGTEGLQRLADRYEQVIVDETGAPFPEDPEEQLLRAVEAVFRSWNGRRARDYRRLEGIPDDLGTAVNVQAMVFGNRGPDSGTGVAFTRDPATGERTPYGDFLVDAQGEDVVAGIRHTEPLDALAERFPACHEELLEVLDGLERRYRDMCDVEFTIEDGRLWILQTRVGKRTAEAAVRMAVEMAEEGLIDAKEAVVRVRPDQVEKILHPRFDPDADYTPLARGLAASPGAATGVVVFTADEAEERAAEGEKVILVRPETSPDDLHGIVAAQGVLTSHGGLVSHAAVVARGIGKPAVCGASAIRIDVRAGAFEVDGSVVRDGDVISLDGTTGEVVVGEVPVVAPTRSEQLETLLGWADKLRRLGVKANADTAEDAARARSFGAEGIGLARTEHMFMGDRLPLVQRLILSEDGPEARAALNELRTMQREDFRGLLEAMDGLPVIVRLLDPPLHEFLPDIENLLVREAEGKLDGAQGELLLAAIRWREQNPMLGIRGVRLAILKPEIYRMQARAVAEAALDRVREGGDPKVGIMIPLTVSAAELDHVLADVRGALEEILTGDAAQVDVLLGTMVETPRAALVAGEIATGVDFISFGTNDLTQMTFGFSRDDIEARLMEPYLELALIPHNPFASIDPDGIGRLLRIAVEEARAANPEIEIGICGEHGGDPASIALCDELGIDYVSCSPFRTDVARLAAAHAAVTSR